MLTLERSSGYLGFRCDKCHNWSYAKEIKDKCLKCKKKKMARVIQIEMYEFFCRVVRNVNGNLREEFEYVVANSPKEAIANFEAKDSFRNIAEIFVYDSADDYHRGKSSLCFTQKVTNFPGCNYE